MPHKLVAPKRLKLEKIARLTLQEIRYICGLGEGGLDLGMTSPQGVVEPKVT